MTTSTARTTAKLFIFNHPAAELLEEMPVDYYRECQITGAGSVEVQLDDYSTEIIAGTRYLPADVAVVAVVDGSGVLQVLCTQAGGEPVVMREFGDWTSYTVRRRPRG
ncbi:hypothetical protein DQP55_25345 [Mycolicibacterium sp. GF69]|uniref:hypothetical protein n=1 Tax=Mycolicibacterium sp. GF69 TaxID=2267251 RepID=UPI000DCDBB40|nr:hypothetical protein [Mycolicibacterium sp. GF69]RAV05703.1 hypothetical protein DQP55_25345 [Mycolicibacterium sp. GF69]